MKCEFCGATAVSKEATSEHLLIAPVEAWLCQECIEALCDCEGEV